MSGVGTHLSEILTECGVIAPPDCECKRWMRQMDEWGVIGCREHKGTIAAHLQAMAWDGSWHDPSKWLNLAKVAARGYLSVSDLIDEAILRAQSADHSRPTAQ